jgi:predicted 2-oxoglutarate/Fe(II)-dependent dioxygenase YbiX
MQVMAELRQLQVSKPESVNAPVLTIPGVLCSKTCRQLIDLYETHGGRDSGFMRDENGVTVPKLDHSHKHRTDYNIEDEELLAILRQRLTSALHPMVLRAFQFDATRIERWLIARYDGEVGGHFRPHRDNTTKGTAHRKFACTINLNAEEYEGGDLCFPEFGQATYRAPTGGAVVFSCSLLHEARPVTKGKRYAFLPFLYDDAGARVREQNLPFVSPELQNYRSGLPPLAGDKS